MNKGNSGFSDYKGSGGRTNHSEHNSGNSNLVKTISKDRLEHSNKGEYTEHNRPKSGGHGQDSIDYMDKNKIPYEIVVRDGRNGFEKLYSYKGEYHLLAGIGNNGSTYAISEKNG